jgi:hypothetical protein
MSIWHSEQQDIWAAGQAKANDGIKKRRKLLAMGRHFEYNIVFGLVCSEN